jgi:hypothetical protein
MAKFTFLCSFLFIVVSCNHRPKSTLVEIEAIHNPDSSKPEKTGSPTMVKTDSSKSIRHKSVNRYEAQTIYPFPDSSYRLTLDIFDATEYDEDKKNATVTFNRYRNGQPQRLFQDSLYCMDQMTTFQDFNNDRVEDLLIFYYSGGRSNPSFHLYLVDTLNHRLNYIKGFEEIPSPELDTVNNIISGTAMYNADSYGVRFYKINSHNKLIHLGHGYDANLDDTLKYERAIKKILRERRD